MTRITIALFAALVLGSAQEPAPLAQTRAALGGDAALTAVTSFTVNGSLMRDVGPIIQD